MHDENRFLFVRFDEISEAVMNGADVSVERCVGRYGAGGRKREADGGVTVRVENRGEGGVDGWIVGRGRWSGLGDCVWGGDDEGFGRFVRSGCS